MRNQDTSLFIVGLSQCVFIIPKAWIPFAVTSLGLKGEGRGEKRLELQNHQQKLPWQVIQLASLAVPPKLPVDPPIQYGSRVISSMEGSRKTQQV